MSQSLRSGRTERVALETPAPLSRPPSASVETAPEIGREGPAEPRWPFGLTLFVALSVSAILWAAIFALGGVVYRWATTTAA